MKKFRIIFFVFFVFIFCTGTLASQSLKGMSLNGATGLYSIPTGRIGWERSSDLGLDLGYHAIIKKGVATHIPKAALSFFKWVELSLALDLQPDTYYGNSSNNDFIGGVKIQFPLEKTALALGANLQSLNLGSESPKRYNAGQVYLAVSYSGIFFEMPAETTVVVGKTFIANHSDKNLDFGMGFDLILFPKVFERYVHWIVDFSNFSYSVEPWSVVAKNRGVVNTGLRIDLTVIPVFRKFKFVVDILATDIFDENRAFSVGGVFGIPIL